MRNARRTERAFAKVEKKFNDKAHEEVIRYEDRKRSLEGQMGELRAALAALADQSGGIGEHCVASRRMAAQTVLKRSGTFVEGFRSTATSRAPEVANITTILDALPTADGVTHAR